MYMYAMQHVAAVLARKRQEDVQKAKKLQQIEEDRKMAEELHKQRLEREVHLQIHVQYLFLCTSRLVLYYQSPSTKECSP